MLTTSDVHRTPDKRIRRIFVRLSFSTGTKVYEFAARHTKNPSPAWILIDPTGAEHGRYPYLIDAKKAAERRAISSRDTLPTHTPE